MSARFQERVRLGTLLRGDPIKTAGKHTVTVTQYSATAHPCSKNKNIRPKRKMGATEEVDGYKDKDTVVQEILKESVEEEISDM